MLAFFPRWTGDRHAGRTRRRCSSSCVPRSCWCRAEPGDRRPIAESDARSAAGGMRAVAPNGVLGDPRGATAEEGTPLLSAIAVDLTRAVDAWRDRDAVQLG